MKTLLVARSALKRMQEAFSFWEAKQTVIQGAIKYPQGFSIDTKRKNGKPLGFLYYLLVISFISLRIKSACSSVSFSASWVMPLT